MKRLLFSFLALTACNTDFFEVEGIGDASWTPTVAIPVGYVEYSLDELLQRADSLVEVREDGNRFITLVYKQQLISESAQDFVELTDQAFQETYTINIPPPFPDPVTTSGVSFRSEEAIAFDFNTGINASIDSAIFSSGVLDIEVTSTIKAQVQAQLILPNLKSNGEPLIINMNLDNNGPSVTRTDQKLLEGFKMALTDNKMEAIVALDITTTGYPVSSGDAVTLNIDIHGLTFKSFYGNVGTRSLGIKDERFTYNIFNEIGVGEVYFTDPRLVITVNNSFGIPIAIDFTGIYAEDPENGRIDLEGEIVNTPQIIGAPDYSQIGETVTSVISINRGNSNFADIVSALPTALNLSLNTTSNPEGTNKNFILDTSKIDVEMAAELPLDLRILGLQNSITFDFRSGETDFMNSGKLRIKTENGFPLQGKTNVIFRNEQGELLSISPNDNFDSPLFEAAPVDENGMVTSEAITIVNIALDRKQFSLIEQATEVEVEIELNTTDAASGQNVKLLSNYAVKVNVGIESSLVVNTGE